MKQRCWPTRSGCSAPDTMNTVVAPVRAARTASASSYSATATVQPASEGARDGSRTTRRWATPAEASRRATRPPSRPVDPVTASAIDCEFTGRPYTAILDSGRCQGTDRSPRSRKSAVALAVRFRGGVQPHAAAGAGADRPLGALVQVRPAGRDRDADHEVQQHAHQRLEEPDGERAERDQADDRQHQPRDQLYGVHGNPPPMTGPLP